MSEKEAIQQAYEAKVAELWKTMFTSYTIASGNTSEQSKADVAFKSGLVIARQVRDKAQSLV